jgi:hypothetical protein
MSNRTLAGAAGGDDWADAGGCASVSNATAAALQARRNRAWWDEG